VQNAFDDVGNTIHESLELGLAHNSIIPEDKGVDLYVLVRPSPSPAPPLWISHIIDEFVT